MTDLSADALAASIIAGADGGTKKTSAKLLPTIVAVAVLTLVAVGGGAGVGLLIGGQAAPEVPPAAAAPEATEAEASPVAETPTAEVAPTEPTLLVKLPPVVTTIASPAKTLLRIEASIVIHSADVDNPEVLAAQIQSDTLTFVRTLDLAQIEGARGLLHLREDLKERAQLRSPAVVDYLIQSLVAQ